MSSAEQVNQDATRPRILVGVDGSEDGLRAVRYGARAAQRTRGLLHLVHAVDDAVMAGAWGVVYDPGALQEAGEHANIAAIDTAREAGLPEDQVQAEVVLGNAAAVLARMSEGAELLVVGRRSVSGLERMFIGSTSVALADAAKCPVVVISAAANPAPTGDRGRIAVGVDADEHSAETLRWAMREAAARHVPLTVLHVARSGGGLDREAVEAAAQQGISEMLQPIQATEQEVETEIVVAGGTPVDELVALSSQVDLLVLGVQKPKLLGIHLGGVMRAVLAHAQSPVVLVE